MRSLAQLLAIALLLGTALLGAGAAVHPVLAGDPAAQLGIIAATGGWRAIHLAMLAGSGLVIAGLWVRFLLDRSGAPGAVLASLALIALGLAINALNIAYMAGSGWHMATMFREGNASMAAMFAVTHPIGLMAARFGNFLVALGALVLGWAEWEDATQPLWIAALAWLAALGGFVGVLFFDEASRLALAAVALLSGWQVATGIRALGWAREVPRTVAASPRQV
ncbi:MAG TPA: hypothetical protein VF041_03685 [Gemmatimonadaceae bacterium]